MFRFVDTFLPVANREWSTSRHPQTSRICSYDDAATAVASASDRPNRYPFLVPLEGWTYVCCFTDQLTHHDDCILCDVEIPGRSEDDRYCYVRTPYKLDEHKAVYMFGIPCELSNRFVDGMKNLRKRKRRSLPKGSILCPYHDDRHKSAVRHEDGSIYCFVCRQKFLPRPAFQ